MIQVSSYSITMFFFFKCPFLNGCANQKYCVYYLAYSEFTEIVTNVVYKKYATDIHSSIISLHVGNEN